MTKEAAIRSIRRRVALTKAASPFAGVTSLPQVARRPRGGNRVLKMPPQAEPPADPLQRVRQMFKAPQPAQQLQGVAMQVR